MKPIPSNRSDLFQDLVQVKRHLLQEEKFDSPEDLLNQFILHAIDQIPDAAFDPIQPLERGILFFHQEVGEEEVVDFQHDLVRTHLNLDPKLPITLNLSSVGGSVYAGLALISTIYEIQRQGRVVNVHVQGVAMSMGSVIAQVANRRTIERGAHFMLHKISYGMGGSSDEHEEQLAFTNKLHDSLFGIYSARTGKTIEYYKEKLTRRNWYMTAEEALAEGLVDEVVQPPLYSKIVLPVKPTKAKRGKK